MKKKKISVNSVWLKKNLLLELIINSSQEKF